MIQDKPYTWRQAILQSNLPAVTRHLLLTLSCYVNDMQEGCYPSTKTLEKVTGLSERTVITHLKIAAEKGWLVIEKHGFKGQEWARNHYHIAFPKGAERDSVAYEKGTEPDDKKALKEVQSNRPYILDHSNNTPLNPPKGKVKRKSTVPHELPDWLDPKSWNDFIEHRKEINSPPTKRAVELLIEKLDGLRKSGNDPTRVINQSIEFGYKGLFEIKDSRSNGPPGHRQNSSWQTNKTGGNKHAGFNERNYQEGATPIEDIDWAK